MRGARAVGPKPRRDHRRHKLPRTNEGNCVFYYEGSDGGSEKCLEVMGDGCLIYSESPNYYAAKGGAKFHSETLTVKEAKERWPALADKIDRAVLRTASH